ncbi:MAG: DUF4878 domain-containing protein [Prolixibacteraceae bacterium]|jgi:predicted peroxiredoxin|nr:DUF4878 domain-containing protein [Prolixibacteraceae bacterium]NLX29117.1 DUF4878 domain-containing protein [Bacteroidales bacterium]HNQ37809.1 DUF4878 domain-containing protein [Prolixibacteraceae bacterium]HOY52421.1 DUF4878 domain-containing protein [Prolixibacteraceae bacterium]HPJ77694.1 DUF4878 domain-containing protein [Prolixibacteraceae bacterium]
MKKQGIVIVFSIVLALAMISCGGNKPGGNTPSKTVEKLFKYVIDKDYDNAVTLYANKDGKALDEEEVAKVKALLPMVVKVYEKDGGLKSVKVTKETITEDGLKATVDIVQSYGNGKEEENSIDLVKIEGDWYVLVSNNMVD